MRAQGRLPTLDWLRGAAAFSVMIYHYQLINPGGAFAHGYLAVDFFFVLSGFVIAGAYESRFASGMTVLSFFFRHRLIRLYPMILVSTLLGVASFWLLGQVSLLRPSILLRQLFLVPALARHSAMYPFNNVQWSIFFELAANLVHITLLRRLGVAGLGLLVGLSACALCAVAWTFHTLDAGNGYDTAWAGFARVGFSYIAGVLLWRLHKAGRLPALGLHWTVSTGILLLALAVPTVKFSVASWIVDLVVVMTVFPIVLVASRQPGRAAGLLPRVFAAAGELSYPIYLLQIPILTILGICALRAGIVSQAHPLPIIVSVIATLGLSAAALAWYDMPVRRLLNSAARPAAVAASSRSAASAGS